MTVFEFESYLQKGLGRAILLLRKEPDKSPFREAVWCHAIHDPRYDRQCNASRGHYIKALFDCFPDGETMLSELFRIYADAKGETDDIMYYVDNLYEMAQEQVDGASLSLDGLCRTVLKKLFEFPNPVTNGCDHERDCYHLAAEKRYKLNPEVLCELVRDGIELLEKSERYNSTDFIDFFDNQLRVSREVLDAVLADLTSEGPAVNAIFESYPKESEKNPARTAAKMDNSLPEPKNWIEAIDFAIQSGRLKSPINKSLWENLSLEDKEEIARLAEEERDQQRRFVLLWQLYHYGDDILRQYPRDPSPLISELTASGGVSASFPAEQEEQTLWMLSKVVSKISHPAVRDFALKSLSHYADKGHVTPYSQVAKAWIANYRPEDDGAFLEFVTSITDRDLLHRLVMDVIGAELRIPEPALIYLYENNPCSSCRNRIFTCLMGRYGDLTNLPESLALICEEGKLDCDYGTRLTAHAVQIARRENNNEFC